MPWSTCSPGQLVVIEAWLSLTEGLTAAVATCPQPLQPDVVATQRHICDALIVCPGNKL
jgi:hypothetical protein